jgi:hypothetical protein
MSGRFVAALFLMLVLAVGIGILAGKAQKVSSAAPRPAPTPTQIPVPPANEIYIIPDPSNPNNAVFFSGQSTTTAVVPAGQKITWVNKDTQSHSVTADNGAFSSDVLQPGESFSWVAKRGRYPYGDFLHPDVHGILIVQ